jgi:type IV secretory pathway VirB2 component (pilin)
MNQRVKGEMKIGGTVTTHGHDTVLRVLTGKNATASGGELAVVVVVKLGLMTMTGIQRSRRKSQSVSLVPLFQCN